uniref:Uncharacterized protein n=1 Tax=Noctiluca scintillans TaxID=2966 RepID=A0A7S1ACE5_NOCSC
MPSDVLSKTYSRLHRGWLFFLSIVAVGLLRRWLLSDVSKDRPRVRVGEQDARRPRSGRSKSRESARQSGNAISSPTLSPPQKALASEEELGPSWHFGGRRRWQWMHNGSSPNGWIEFGCNGTLRTTWYPGSWEILPGGKELVASFGKCHHVLALDPAVDPNAPEFFVRERIMRDGSKARDRPGPTSRGRLDMQESINDAP